VNKKWRRKNKTKVERSVEGMNGRERVVKECREGEGKERECGKERMKEAGYRNASLRSASGVANGKGLSRGDAGNEGCKKDVERAGSGCLLLVTADL
jgi:hypothetical protein